jgi:hypothetical protein
MPYGFAAWVERNAGKIILGSAAAGLGVALLTPHIFKTKKAAVIVPPLITADAARKGGCAGCREGAVAYESDPAFVPESAWHNQRQQGYVGFHIGPSSRYPGARAPATATPIYGTYRGQARWTYPDEQGAPIGWENPVQSVANHQPASIFRPPFPRPYARAGVPQTPVGPEVPGFYRWKVSKANTEIQTQDYPGGEVGYNLSVGNLPPAAEGNLSAPVTYQDINPQGGIVNVDEPHPPKPYLAPRGGYAARYSLAGENGPAPGWKRSVQSVATAQFAKMDDDDSAAYGGASFELSRPHRPGWKPMGQTGPLGSAKMGEFTGDFALDDAGGGYVSPGAYRTSADGTYTAPHPYLKGNAQALAGFGDLAVADAGYADLGTDAGYAAHSAYAPLERPTVVDSYEGDYQELVVANTIDIQTQDYPGGEGSYNLSVGNLPPAANGNLYAPVTYQQLASAGGVSAPDEPRTTGNLPWLDFPSH